MNVELNYDQTPCPHCNVVRGHLSACPGFGVEVEEEDIPCEKHASEGRDL